MTPWDSQHERGQMVAALRTLRLRRLDDDLAVDESRGPAHPDRAGFEVQVASLARPKNGRLANGLIPARQKFEGEPGALQIPSPPFRMLEGTGRPLKALARW